MRKIVLLVSMFAIAANMMAADHVMAATKHAPKQEVSATLNLSLQEAQDYAVAQNRSLKNADLAVQKAYATRWQTIASMLPSVDMSWAYQSMMGYKMNFGGMPIEMPDNGTFGITASIGINGQAIVG
ncbi:MAG: TolC family protein, partial [Paludibacteraceae bacterium]|nr:TolC family protein [Paludibacteraceae bacterium]